MSQRGVAGEQRRGPVSVLDPSGCARSRFWNVPACYVPFLSLCSSFHTGDKEGQHSGLNLGLIEGQLRIPGGTWVMESDRLVFKF